MANPINELELKSRIPGWGSDLEPAMRPGVPKERTPPRDVHVAWTQPSEQFKRVEYLKTVARDRLTPVFGTPNPPKLLSGQMRRLAYSMPEGWISRWVTLLAADRVDMIEHIVKDVLTGKAGNPITQTGVMVEFKERGQLVRPQRRRSLLIGGLGVVAFVGYRLLRSGAPAKVRARSARWTDRRAA